jgi:glycerol-3-phosphate dehydrogenase (NAD(P)+)
MTMRAVAVLGAGSWGTALAVHLARTGHVVRLWGRDQGLVAALRERRVNAAYLPDVTLPEAVTVTGDAGAAVDGVACVVVAVPTHGVRAVVRAAAAGMAAATAVVSTVKGLERGTLLRVSEILVEECAPGVRVAVLSGPSFARDLARQLPTAVSVASYDEATVAAVQQEFKAPYLRLYGTTDVVGVELGGALKNVIAIAAGVAEGLGLGESARAALITRGLAEITRLACAEGARRETLAGLTGLGDLVLTCSGMLSRNRRVGVELGRGRPLVDVLGGMRMVAEGVRTTEAALALAARHGIELPIAAQVGALIEGRTDARAALEELMLRPQRTEVG